jgi:RNA polymerase sigma factor (sigma-70 family)
MTLTTASQEPAKRFEEWWTNVEDEIIAIGTSYLGSRSAADDVAQDVAYAAFCHFSKFDENTGFPAFQKWTKKRTRWLAIGALRLRKREILATDSALDLTQIARTSDETSSQPTPQPDRNALLAAIAQLPRLQRQVALLTLQGYSNKTIAKSLKIKESTVRSVFRHAREHLSRDHLATDPKDTIK